MTRLSAVFPKKLIQPRMNRNGTVRTPNTNWRRVRPREMRARNRPTNGAQATHHAQKNRVQAPSHSLVSSGVSLKA